MQHFDAPENHDQLNPQLWSGQELKRPVQLALLKIARVYYKFLGIDGPVIDILISGSQANYNYNSHSDIDLHLVMDYSKVSCDMDIDELFKTKRDLWREEHDIDILGMPVEVYVEDVNKPAVSASYSLLKTAWVKQPQKSTTTPDADHIERVCRMWMKAIRAALKTRDLAQIEQIKNILWAYRKVGLAREGEFGTPNLAFKTLRNAGVTDQLLHTVKHLKDRELSLESNH
jgi:hypothetical protein